tara:strand:+ start:308 stop:448 length:141 start_codon:yes stop_codon:yes gene_type:complete
VAFPVAVLEAYLEEDQPSAVAFLVLVSLVELGLAGLSQPLTLVGVV